MSHDIATEAGVVRPEMAPLDGATHGVQTKGPGAPLPKFLKGAAETADYLNRGRAAQGVWLHRRVWLCKGVVAHRRGIVA